MTSTNEPLIQQLMAPDPFEWQIQNSKLVPGEKWSCKGWAQPECLTSGDSSNPICLEMPECVTCPPPPPCSHATNKHPIFPSCKQGSVYHSQACVLFFSLSYPQTLPQTRLITSPPTVTATQKRICRLGGRKMNSLQPTTGMACHWNMLPTDKEIITLLGTTRLPKASPLVAHLAIQEGFVRVSLLTILTYRVGINC